jgi:cytochrome c5
MTGRGRLVAAAFALLITSSADTATDAPSVAEAGGADALPAGAGRDQFIRSCAVCHPIERVVAQRRSVEQWDAMIARMVALGARASEEDQQRIFEYLVQYYSTDGA